MSESFAFLSAFLGLRPGPMARSPPRDEARIHVGGAPDFAAPGLCMGPRHKGEEGGVWEGEELVA